MKIFVFFLCLFGLAAGSATAALPPLYQSLVEYKRLLEEKELSKNLGSEEVIMEIKREEKGFRILTSKSALEVGIVYEPQDHPGPAKFHFIFHPKKSLEN